MSVASSGLVNRSDAATAVAFNVEVKLPASEAAAAAVDEATRGQYDEEPVSVVSTIVDAATATLLAAAEEGDTDGSHGRLDELEHGVDNMMKKMGIHGMTPSVSLLIHSSLLYAQGRVNTTKRHYQNLLLQRSGKM